VVYLTCYIELNLSFHSTLVNPLAGTDNAIIDVNSGAQPDVNVYIQLTPSSTIITPASTAM
jgi:hypothetical protein